MKSLLSLKVKAWLRKQDGFLLPVLFNQTRWSSHYEMLER
jgi:hypothetical protein